MLNEETFEDVISLSDGTILQPGGEDKQEK